MIHPNITDRFRNLLGGSQVARDTLDQAAHDSAAPATDPKASRAPVHSEGATPNPPLDAEDETPDSPIAEEVRSIVRPPLNKNVDSLAQYLYSLLSPIDEYNNKAQVAAGKIAGVRQKQNVINTLKEKIQELSSNPAGTFDCTNNPEVCQLLTNAQAIGAPINATKTVYTKDERDLLLTKLDRTNKRFDEEIQILTQEVKKCQDIHQELYKMLKDLMDKYKSLIDKIIALINPRHA